MRLILCSFSLATTIASVCLAQSWELGASGGYGWYRDPSIANTSGSAQAGIPARAAFGVTFTQNMYNHVGGGIRYLFRFWGPGTQVLTDGVEPGRQHQHRYVRISVLYIVQGIQRSSLHRRGCGYQSVHRSGNRFVNVDQPLTNFALLRPVTEVEPAISVGGGVKFLVPKRVQLRADFRAYMTPLPDQLFRPVGPSVNPRMAL